MEELTLEYQTYIEATKLWLKSQRTIVEGLENDKIHHDLMSENLSKRIEIEKRFYDQTKLTFNEWCRNNELDPIELLDK